MPRLKTYSPKHFYSIKEVSEMLQESVSTLRYWEEEFPQLRPRTTPGGTRQYAARDLEILRTIKRLLRDKKLTILGAQEALRLEGKRLETREQTLERLYRLRDRLLEARSTLLEQSHVSEHPEQGV